MNNPIYFEFLTLKHFWRGVLLFLCQFLPKMDKKINPFDQTSIASDQRGLESIRTYIKVTH
jgi:hypothetical protein